jgi:hypothetical protein
MNPKLTMLYLLIGTIIGLTHHGNETLAKMKRQLSDLRWRNVALVMLWSVKSASKI